jgi:hypothetical protein
MFYSGSGGTGTRYVASTCWRQFEDLLLDFSQRTVGETNQGRSPVVENGPDLCMPLSR